MFKSLKFKLLTTIPAFVLLLLLSVVLIMNGCGSTAPTTSDPAASSDVLDIGEGAQTFTLIVTNLDGSSKTFQVSTDEGTIGDALLGVDLIQGETSSFGLMVTTVDGVTANFDEDQTFWGFYIDGEFATQGVDATTINTSSVYELRRQR